MAKAQSKRKPWTSDEVKQLKKIYRNRSTAEVAEELGRTISSIEAKARSLDLKKTKKYLKSIGRA
jgi:hypothetical protein